MRSFADLPLRRKLSLSFTVTIAVVTGLACTAVFVYEYGAVRRAFVESIATSTRITADNSTAVLAFNDAAGAEQILGALRSESQVVAAVLFDADQRPFAVYTREGHVAPDALPSLPPGDHFHGGRLVCLRPVEEGARRWGTLYLEASLTGMYQRWGTYGAFLATAALLAALIGWGVRAILQRRIERPILELVTTARAVTERRDFSLRARVSGRDELGELAASFNAMLDRIEAGLAEQQAAAAEIQKLNTHLEQRVRDRTAELEEANRELESFSYSVSHDLRAPLRHIQGYGEMLVRAMGDTMPDKARRYLKVITDASSEMGQLIDDLLTFSRMGRSEMRAQVVDLAVILDDVRNGFELALRDRDVTWQVEPLPAVRGDEAMLKLVLLNLVSNALKFTRTRPNAVIEFRHEGSADGMETFCLRDNGVGFDMTYHDKLFGVFQRLHRAEDFEGTGIGLANVRRIITRHGGTVWANSAPGAGAAFFFTLPAAVAAPVQPVVHS